MEFWKKPDRIHVSRSDPATHPDYRRAKEVGEKNFSKMKFKDESERKEYLKAVESNPHNVVGLPAFYPPEQIRSFVSFEGSVMSDEERVKDFIYKHGVRDTELYCDKCEKITPHSISPDACWCKKCGDQKRWRSIGIEPIIKPF